jgi:tRNA1(Val) A37 N6-methylase TrmN6
VSHDSTDGTTVDRFLGGLVSLVQPTKGHRAGLDAALLQACVPAEATGLAVDLGTGCGVVAFSLAARATGLSVIGVDSDTDILALARRGLKRAENRAFAGRVRLVELDVAARREAREAAGLADGSVDFVLMNPPFDEPGTVRPSPDPARRRAHVGEEGGFEDWARTAAALCRSGGKVAVIHRADRLQEVLTALDGRFGALAVLPVHAHADRAAIRVLVHGARGSRAPLSILPGLTLHAADGTWTQTVEAILAGKRGLAPVPEPAATGAGQVPRE